MAGQLKARLGAMGIVAAMVGIAGAHAASATDPLAPFHGRARVLLVVAGDPGDPKLARQRQVYAAMAAGARDRDLKLVEAIGATPQADAMRKRFDLTDGGFHAILVGKDGGDKLASDEPLGADQLFPLIDAMPMRQQEMRGKS